MTYVSTCLADGAVGLWELGESVVTTGSTATDQAGLSNGTYFTTHWTGGLTGIPGGGGATAASITDNQTSGVTVGDVVGNRTVDTFTYELWIKVAAWPAAMRGLMGAGTTIIRFSTTGLFRLTKQSVADVCQSTSAIPADSAWHHVVIAKNGGTATKLYLDSVDVSGTVTNQTMVSSSGLGYTLAKSAADNTQAATYAMFAIYPTFLSSTVVANHYSIGSGAAAAVIPDVGMALTVT